MKICSKGDRTNWLYKNFEIKENVNETKRSYCIDTLPDRHNEALLNRLS